jgi:hypothetical protein
MGRQLGATEQQITQIEQPSSWSEGSAAEDFDPWMELTPG